MTARELEITGFLARSGWGEAERKSLAGDASARRYERLQIGKERSILMDANPDKGESVSHFLLYTRFLRDAGLAAPEIYHADEANGLLLLEDLGDDLFARHVAAQPEDEASLYLAATEVLIALHRHGAPADTPDYVPQMAGLAALAYDWYARGATGAACDAGPLQREINNALAGLGEDRVLVLRDYHAENLLWLPRRAGLSRVGLLDYQDAMLGPAAYDLVSLTEDARRDVSSEVAQTCADHYIATTGCDTEAFRLSMALCSAQRNLRILGVFARLNMRDGKPHYIDFIPRVWGHLLNDLAHPALAPLREMVMRDLPAPDPQILARLKAACPSLSPQ